MDHYDSIHHFSDHKGKSLLFSPQRIIIIYTAFRIIYLMRKKLGLETMLEYIDIYVSIIEKHNPHLKHAVSRSLDLIDMNKIYEEARRKDHE